MGWWGIGGDEIMGDHPADVVGMAFREMDTIAQRKGFYKVTVDELTAAFVKVLDQAPKLISGREIAPKAAGEALREALREQLTGDGFALVEEQRLDVFDIFSVVWNALHEIAQSYADTELERRPTLREVISAFTFVLGYKPENYLALIRPTEKRPLYHPLLGVPRATAADLIARCAPEGVAALEVAAKIAQIRQAALFGPRPRGAHQAGIGPYDLLRALQVRGDLAALLDKIPVVDQLNADTAMLRSIVEVAPRAEQPIELEARWAPWITALLASRSGALGSAGLLGALNAGALARLAEHDEHFIEGLVTMEEAVWRLAERQEELAGWGASRPFFGAHLDRGGELDALTNSLRSSSGVVLIADPLPLAPCLVQAWAASTGALARMPLLPSPSGGVDPFYERRERWGVLEGSGGLVLTLSESAERRALRGLLEADPEELASRLKAPADGDVVIAVMTEEVLRAAGRSAPALGEIPRVDLPPLGDWDLLAAWLCQRPRFELMSGEAFGLFDLIDALEAADEDDRFTLEWDAVRPFRDVPSRARRMSLRSGLRAWQRGRRELGSLKERPFFARFIQTEDRLKYLIELDKTLP